MPLRVTQPFGSHAAGDLITDAAEIDAVLASDQAAFVVAVADEPAPVAPTKSAKE
jgi:hypothetical protein